MSETPKSDDKLPRAYDTMMERVKATLDRREGSPTLPGAIEAAKERAVQLGELSSEEAERIGTFLRRDLEDAGRYLTRSQGDFSKWLQFDLELIEDRLAEMFLQVADQTRVQLEMLAEQARHADEYRTGDVTGPGTLQCAECGKQLHFKKTSHIPPCPACHATLFKRIPAPEDEEQE